MTIGYSDKNYNIFIRKLVWTDIVCTAAGSEIKKLEKLSGILKKKNRLQFVLWVNLSHYFAGLSGKHEEIMEIAEHNGRIEA